ncbi:phosphate ABC transporter substrate-binding protein [Vibrio sp. JC009]|uniref:phosphate ABC transporter substrate-binding protein n=1 Tax=Vibrio sp. JC009 TaxID=2912314 RepID=UPI0023B1701F|nr:phosphate ABC transporter substrate-binding protein [Vibrio sp. JC009]WED21911.1 phosphate ABC transporter substrate-binding protein [Vibrio sp. JC009]
MKKILTFAVTSLLSFNALAGMVVIGNPANGATLSESDVKKLFLGKKTRLDGSGNIQIIELQDGSEGRLAFHALATGRTETQLQSAWSRLVFTGKANAPIQVSNYTEMISKVASSPEAIGYVDESAVTGEVRILFKF